MDLNVDAYIPATYITNEFWKLDIYKRIAAIENAMDREEMEDELIDRFGDMPKAVSMLLTVAEIKAIAHDTYVENMKEKGDRIKIEFYERAKINPAMIPDLLKKYQRRLSFSATPTPSFEFIVNSRLKKTEQLEELKVFTEDMREILVDSL